VATLRSFPRGLDISSNLIQMRKVMTGQQSQHHPQRLGATLIVLARALLICWRHSFPNRQIELTQSAKDFY
jgi:hypothetical protein